MNPTIRLHPKDEDALVFYGLPLPVSVNNYANRAYPTKEKTEFLREFKEWQILIGADRKQEVLNYLFRGIDRVQFASRKTKSIIPIELMFIRQMFTKKDGRLRERDCSNYIKLLEDQFAKWILVNDCCFKRINILEIDSKRYRMDEQTIVVLHRPKLHDEIGDYYSHILNDPPSEWGLF